MDPAFEHVAADALPVVESECARATVIMGELWGTRAPTTTYAGTIYADILLGPAGAVPVDAEADERAVYLVDGAASLDGMPLEPQRLYVIRPGVQATLRSDTGGRVMLAGGEAFATPRHVWWNFVSSRRDRIQQAKEDWRAGRFALIPGDDQEFIPVPEAPKTVSYP